MKGLNSVLNQVEIKLEEKFKDILSSNSEDECPLCYD